MPQDMDMQYLLSALDNETNESIMDLTTSKIKTTKNNILQKLQLNREELKKLHTKLKYYKYVDELHDIQYGAYIRWIPLKNPEKIYLTNGGLICDIKILDEGVHIICKNNMNRFFQIKLDENLIFQKLTDQERTILSVLDYLEKQ
jgi:hypothetical protein